MAEWYRSRSAVSRRFALACQPFAACHLIRRELGWTAKAPRRASAAIRPLVDEFALEIGDAHERRRHHPTSWRSRAAQGSASDHPRAQRLSAFSAMSSSSRMERARRLNCVTTAVPLSPNLSNGRAAKDFETSLKLTGVIPRCQVAHHIPVNYILSQKLRMIESVKWHTLVG